jgi:hypothetical protein
MADYGLQRAEYIEAFMKAVDWNIALSRFVAASGRQVPEVLVGKSAYAFVTPKTKDEARIQKTVPLYTDSFIP